MTSQPPPPLSPIPVGKVVAVEVAVAVRDEVGTETPGVQPDRSSVVVVVPAEEEHFVHAGINNLPAFAFSLRDGTGISLVPGLCAESSPS